MPKMTLLDMTQNILSAMDSDNVNSISDTEESEQVAETIKDTYFAMIDEYHLPVKKEIFKLEATDVSTPTKMKIPEIVEKVLWIKYNRVSEVGGDAEYTDIIYLDPKSFLDKCNVRSESSSNVEMITDGDIDFMILNDTPPTYYTSFDDTYLIFDSYHSDLDANLQQSKSMGYGFSSSTWTHLDNAIPVLPINLFSLLLAESKSTCFLNLKQMPNQKEEQKARRQRIALRKSKWNNNGGITTPNYGRK